MAKELGKKGITINAVAPGPVNTELFTVGKTQGQIQGLANMNAFGRLGEAEDIASSRPFSCKRRVAVGDGTKNPRKWWIYLGERHK